jgi:NAD(P)-dependent dehydrogenase (short-subunit alcohol dehydrogenase family)
MVLPVATTTFLVTLIAVALILARQWISPWLYVTPLDLLGQVVVITGGCSGIGKETAKLLYNMNASIILGCRNASTRANPCTFFSTRIDLSPNSTKTLFCMMYELDLASFTSVRAFVAKISDSGMVPNIVITNAGMRHDEYMLTIDGIESHYQINYLSHFLLVDLLIPLMEQSDKQIRVVHVSSSAYGYGYIDRLHYNVQNAQLSNGIFDQIQLSRLEGVYGDTKLMQVMHSKSLQKKFDILYNNQSTNLNNNRAISVAIHPGFVSSNMGRDDKRWLQTAIILLRPLLARSEEQGAINAVYASSSPKLQGGEYLDNCRAMASLVDIEAEVDWLWENSVAIVGER